MWDILKDFAGWVGWFPVAAGCLIILLIGRYFYDKELSIRDQRIFHLKDEIENGKAYQYDDIYKRLTERVSTLNKEMELLKSETNSKQDEIESVSQQLTSAYAEIRELQSKLRSFDDQLEDLLEDDYCETCDPDEEHMFANFINWWSNMYSLIGDTQLVEKTGYCDYCTSPQVKCQVCGSITSLNLDSDEPTECNGGCGNIYTLESYVADKSTQYDIRVSRMETEFDE